MYCKNHPEKATPIASMTMDAITKRRGSMKIGCSFWVVVGGVNVSIFFGVVWVDALVNGVGARCENGWDWWIGWVWGFRTELLQTLAWGEAKGRVDCTVLGDQWTLMQESQHVYDSKTTSNPVRTCLQHLNITVTLKEFIAKTLSEYMAAIRTLLPSYSFNIH